MATQSDLAATYGNNSGKWHDPFITNSNLLIPDNFYTNLALARFMASKFPLYVQAAKRTVSHFITDIQFVGKTGDKDERDQLKSYLIDNLGILDAASQAGLEWFIYGNTFPRIYFPFNRYIVDRREGKYVERSIDIFPPEVIQFDLDSMTYQVPDPKSQEPLDTRPKVKFEFIDRKSNDSDRIKVRFIDPCRMILQMNNISGTIDYIYRFEEFFKADIKQGNKIYQVNETPKEMLQAIRRDQDFCFNSDSIFHMANNFISGISYNGWGIPPILLNYQSMHDAAVLRCLNEAIGLDYMVPIRVITPSASGQGAGMDAAASINLGPWTAMAKEFIKNKRQDPTAMHVLPFPVTYQEFGGSGRQLAPTDLIKLYDDKMLSEAGFPIEVFNMSLQMQVMPTAIRAFEATYIHLQRKLSNMIKWVNKKIRDYQELEQLDVKLALPSVADDMEKRHIWLQLAAGGEVSRETAYKAFSIDSAVEEAKRRAEEDIEIQKIKAKVQSDFEREMTIGSVNQTLDAMMQQQQAPPPGAMGPPPAGGSGGQAPGVTPLDIMQQAEEQAMQLLQIEDNGERRRAMNDLRATNPQLYAIVKQKMEEIRSQGASEGRKMAGKQQ